MQKVDFNPNQVSFDEGLKRIERAVERAGVKGDGVLTSRHPAVVEASKLLTVSAVPGGFRKWQLPVSLSGPSQLFITVADPGVEVPEHSHDEGDGIRFIAGGSIAYEDQELIAGDWMYIPQATKYSFKVGPMGALMCYCYCCCCAGRMDFGIDDLVDPAPMLGP
jgi:hypothetical protein